MASEIKFFCFVAGIQVPLLSFGVTGAVKNFCMGHASMPWSPFLMKLHKGIKLSIFSNDSDFPSPDGSAKLEFDGTIQGIIEVKGNNPAKNLVHLTIVSDGYVWTMKKKSTWDISECMGISHTAAQYGTNVDNQGAQMFSPVVDPTTYVFNNSGVNGDAAKAASMFLTIAYNSEKQDGTYYYCLNGSVYDDKQSLFPEQIVKAGGVLWTSWMNTYFADYLLPYKVGYIEVSQQSKDFFMGEVGWKMIAARSQNLHGVHSYWDMATYFANQMQCEIISIPNPTYISPADLDAVSPTGLLAEFIIKPTTIFGNIPYCNVIFPDQVEERTIKTDYWKEITRVFLPISSIPGYINQAFTETTSKINGGPVTLKDYMSSYNLIVNKNPNVPDVSIYEDVFGACPIDVSFDEYFIRYLANQNSLAATTQLNNILNMEFLKANFSKFQFSITVTPDVRILPGMSVLILDRDGDHMIAYCSGTDYSYDCNSGVSSSISLCYPHSYKLDVSELSEYGNSLSSDQLAKLGTMIGSDFLPLGSDAIDTIYNLWRHTYNGDSKLLKKNLPIYQRDIASYSDFLQFHGSENQDGSLDNNGNLGELMPSDIVDLFDSDEDVYNMTMFAYSFMDPYNESQTPTGAQAIKPEYSTIGKYGPIVPSFITSGVIDCHLKYLKRIANYANI